VTPEEATRLILSVGGRLRYPAGGAGGMACEPSRPAHAGEPWTCEGCGARACDLCARALWAPTERTGTKRRVPGSGVYAEWEFVGERVRLCPRCQKGNV
jgi:hypothetical protein